MVFKDSHIYLHRIFCVNYMSYDVHQLQDVINVHSAHCNIMVLCKPDGGSLSSSHFQYGCIIGTYHVKAIYTRPGMPNHNSHQTEFLWVCWYDKVGQAGTGWNHRQLNCLHFAPLEDNEAFGIIDPSDVLRGCHIVPQFSLGRTYSDSIGLSTLAKDLSDRREYYVTQSVGLPIIQPMLTLMQIIP